MQSEGAHYSGHTLRCNGCPAHWRYELQRLLYEIHLSGTCLQDVREQRQDISAKHTVLRSTTGTNRYLGVGCASKLGNTLSVVGTMFVHSGSAISTEENSGQWMDSTPSARIPTNMRADALNCIEGICINDRLLRSREHSPLIR